MDKKSKVLIGIFLIAILASAFVTYHRYITIKDFPVINSSANEAGVQ